MARGTWHWFLRFLDPGGIAVRERQPYSDFANSCHPFVKISSKVKGKPLQPPTIDEDRAPSKPIPEQGDTKFHRNIHKAVTAVRKSLYNRGSAANQGT
jgi:hypothetical protein